MSVMWKNFHKKWLTTHIERELHYQNESNSNVLENSKIDNVNTNNSNRSKLLVELSFSGKSFLMLMFFSRIPDQIIYIITKPPPNSIPILKSNLGK